MELRKPKVKKNGDVVIMKDRVVEGTALLIFGMLLFSICKYLQSTFGDHEVEGIRLFLILSMAAGAFPVVGIIIMQKKESYRFAVTDRKLYVRRRGYLGKDQTTISFCDLTLR